MTYDTVEYFIGRNKLFQEALQHLIQKITEEQDQKEIKTQNRVKIILSYVELHKKLRKNRIMQRICELRGGEYKEIIIEEEEIFTPLESFFSYPQLLPRRNRREIEIKIEKLIKEKGFDGAVETLLISLPAKEELPPLEELERAIIIPEGISKQFQRLFYQREREKLYTIYAFKLYLYEYNKWYERVMRDIIAILQKRYAIEAKTSAA
ncbi:MAG: hypothetical protein ACI86H_000075 [bacterium]|jgi:hypothetical protein